MVRWCDGALLETDSRPAHAQPAQRWADSDSAWDSSIIKFVKPFTIFTLTGASKNAETTHHRTIAPFMFSIVPFQRTIAPFMFSNFQLSTFNFHKTRQRVGWWAEKKRI
jgi:hypothetical protein